MPLIYEEAAQIISNIADTLKKDNDKSKFFIPKVSNTFLKSVVFSKARSQNTNQKNSHGKSNGNDLRQLFAIIASTIKYAPILREVIINSDLITEKRNSKKSQGKSKKGKSDVNYLPSFRYFTNEWHVMAMVYDLLLSKSGRIIAPKCKSKEYILKNKTRLHGEFIKWKVRNKVRTANDIERFTNPIIMDEPSTSTDTENDDETPVRWIRLNEIKLKTPEELNHQEQELIKQGEIKFVDDWHDVRNKTRSDIGPDSQSKQLVIYKDPFVKNCYGVHPAFFPIVSSNQYKQGKLIIQDRSSCFPATILVDNLKHLDIELSSDFTDKSSKSSSKELELYPNIQLIDSCAAPGNKTTHLTALTLSAFPNLRDNLVNKSVAKKASHQNEKNKKNAGSKSEDEIYHKIISAFERSPFRSSTLSKMTKIAGANRYVSIQTQDFTSSNPQQYPNVFGLVVDPSCSGSGIFGRRGDNLKDTSNKTESKTVVDPEQEAEFAEEQDDEDDEKEKEETSEGKEEQDLENRLLKLSGFQYKIVKHALSFPKAQVVVYSTCSIHPQENEHVVERLLNDKQVSEDWGWTVQSREFVIKDWPHRGIVEELANLKTVDDKERLRIAEGCIRAKPKEDGGIGFFAVCFVRKS